MTRAWSIRQYREGDEYQINKMRAAIGGWGKGGSIDLDYWRWKFKRAPAGSSIIFVAANKNRIIGHYAIIPIKMKIFSESLLGSQAEDAVTDPHYKRQGIMIELFKRALMEAGKRGMTVTYGFPNKQSGPGHLKAGWRLICEVPKLIKILNIKKVSSHINYKMLQLPMRLVLKAYDLFRDFEPSPSRNNIKIFKTDAFDQRSNDLWENASRDYDFIVERRMEYLNWRYIQNPLFKYTIYTAQEGKKLTGYIVLQDSESSEYKGVKFGFISDLLCEPNNRKVLSDLVTKAIIHFREKDVDLIRCQMMRGNQYYNMLKKHGFFRFGKKMFILHINAQEHVENLEKLIKDKKIYITYGDGF